MAGDGNIFGSLKLNSGVNTGDTTAVAQGLSFDIPLATVAQFQQNAFNFTSQNSVGARGFLDSVFNRQQAAVSKTAQQSFDLTSTAFDTIRQMNRDQLAADKYGYKKGAQLGVIQSFKPGSGCFITTAVCELDGKPDDCDELETLRDWRDKVLGSFMFGEALIAEYYETAPGIVEAISKRDDHSEQFARLRDDFILPAVVAIKRGDDMGAFKLYTQCVLVARQVAEGEQ